MKSQFCYQEDAAKHVPEILTVSNTFKDLILSKLSLIILYSNKLLLIKLKTLNFSDPDVVHDTPITNATEVEEERNMKRKQKS